jgi:hypothetical protein
VSKQISNLTVNLSNRSESPEDAKASKPKRKKHNENLMRGMNRRLHNESSNKHKDDNEEISNSNENPLSPVESSKSKHKKSKKKKESEK